MEPITWKLNRAARRMFASLGFYVDRLDIGHDLIRNVSTLLGQQPSLIFDVGANQGAVSREYLKAFSHCRIHAFEPDSRVYPELETLAATNPRLMPFNIALGESETTATMNMMAASELNSLLPVTDPLPPCFAGGGAAVTSQATVQVTTLDNHVEQHNIKQIDLLKTDAQGYDLSILRGAKGMLSENRVKLIYSEVVFTPLYQGEPLFYDVAMFLHQYGYRLVDLYGKRRDQHHNIIWADALFAAPQ